MFVEVFGRKSYFIIPINGPAVKGVIPEIFRILEFDENALVVELGEIEQTHVAIAEGELQQVARDILGAGDVYEFCIHFGLFVVIGKDSNFWGYQQIITHHTRPVRGSFRHSRHDWSIFILNLSRHLSMACRLIVIFVCKIHF